MYIETESLYRCPNCGIIHEDCLEENRYGIDDYCRRCGEEVKFHSPVPYDYVCVAAYDTHQEFGGPEEGGWWYTAGDRVNETVRCYSIGDLPQAELYYQQLWDAMYPCVRCYAHRIAPEHFPIHRPYYC